MQLRLLAAIFIFLFLPAFLVSAQTQTTETLSITTYYPSPYGVYNLFRLQPNDQNAPGTSCPNLGEIYYDASDNKPYGCMVNPFGTGYSWQEIGGSCKGIKALLPSQPFKVTVTRNSPNILVSSYTATQYAAVTLSSVESAARFAAIFVYVETPEHDANDGYVLFIDPSGTGGKPEEIGRVGARAVSPMDWTEGPDPAYDSHTHQGTGATQTHHHGAFAIVPLVNRTFYIALQDYYYPAGTQDITIYPVGYIM